MQIERKGFPAIIPDNDEIYFEHFVGVLEAVDEYASMTIQRTPHSYHIRIAPSIPLYLEPLLREVLRFNNMFGIHLELSKSIKSSSVITFDIELCLST